VLIVKYRSWSDRFLQDERGNTESALVLIPLVFLFLCAMQLILVIFLRNESAISSQNQASTRAISGELSRDDTIISLDSPDSFQRLRILVTKKDRQIPLLIPGLSAILGSVIESTEKGIAVIEQR
jgi:hypothetical protein